MKRLALLLTGALLAASPAHADFFDDLGDALDKLGNSIGDTVDDAFTRKPDNTTAGQPATDHSKPQDVPGITWNPPPPTTSFSGASLYTPGNVPTPPALPASRRNLSTAAFPTGRQIDDAPPPRRAPHREAVQSSYIAPLPGFTEAPPRPVAAYSPVMAAASLGASVTPALPAPARLPAVKPVALPPSKPAAAPAREIAAITPPVPPAALPVSPPAPPPAPSTMQPAAAAPQHSSFAITFGSSITTVSDSLLQIPGQRASGSTKSLIEATAKALASNPEQRLKLHAEAVAENDQLAAARRRSFDRALLVKRWLVDAGVRSTRIDLDVTGAGNADAIALSVYSD